MSGASIKFRWDPAAVEYLLTLEDEGQADVAREILTNIRARLGRNPGIYRFVRVSGLNPDRARRLTIVQRLFLGSRLPYLVYYRFHKVEGVVEVLRIRHARQKPIERT